MNSGPNSFAVTARRMPQARMHAMWPNSASDMTSGVVFLSAQAAEQRIPAEVKVESRVLRDWVMNTMLTME